MLSAVPDRAAFATHLAAVRAWAKASGLYGTQRGVCGLCWAILTAYVSRHLPHDAPAAANGGGEGWLSGPDRPAAERRLQRFLAEFFVRPPLPPLPLPAPSAIASRLIGAILRGVQGTWRDWEWPQPVELTPRTKHGPPHTDADRAPLSPDAAGDAGARAELCVVLVGAVWRPFGAGGGLMPVLTPVYPARR